MNVNIYPSIEEKTVSSYKIAYHHWRFKKYKEIVYDKIKNKDKFLDIGCQEGILLANLPECKKYGLEVEKKYLKLAQKRNPGTIFRIGSAQHLPYDNGVFDWVSCTEVIEHIDDPILALTEIKRVLKKNGYLLLSTYNHWNIFNIITGFVLLKKPKLEGHVREYNWRSLLQTLSKNFIIELRTQAGSSVVTDSLFNLTRLPLAEFMIVLCRKK